MMSNPSRSEQLLSIVASAAPLLNELSAAKANLESYRAIIEEYTVKTVQEKEKVDRIMSDLSAISDSFVSTYLATQSESPVGSESEPEPTTEPTE